MVTACVASGNAATGDAVWHAARPLPPPEKEQLAKSAFSRENGGISKGA